MHVRFDARLARGADAEERRERGAFVIGGAAPEVAVAVFYEREWIGLPRLRFARGRLDIEVVVDGDGRQIAATVEAAVDDRIASRFEDIGLAAEIADRRCRELGAAAAAETVGTSTNWRRAFSKRSRSLFANATSGFLSRLMAAHSIASGEGRCEDEQ
jgi:hypothetical protein